MNKISLQCKNVAPKPLYIPDIKCLSRPNLNSELWQIDHSVLVATKENITCWSLFFVKVV